MRTADDLQRITPLIWRELNVLSVPFIRCGVFIIDEPTGERPRIPFNSVRGIPRCAELEIWQYALA